MPVINFKAIKDGDAPVAVSTAPTKVINFKSFKEGSLTQDNLTQDNTGQQPAQTKTDAVIGKVATGVSIAAATAAAVDTAFTGGPENPDAPLPGEQKVEEITGLAASIAGLIPILKPYSAAAVGLEPVVFHLLSALIHLFKHHAQTIATPVAKQ